MKKCTYVQDQGSRGELLFQEVWSVAWACQNKVLGDDGFWSDI